MVRLVIAYECGPQGIALGDYPAAGLEHTLLGIEQRYKAAVKQWQRSSDIGNDPVNLFRQLDPRAQILDEFNAVREPIGNGCLTRHMNDLVGLDGVDLSGAETAGDERPDADARAESRTVSPGLTFCRRAVTNALTRPASAIIAPWPQML